MNEKQQIMEAYKQVMSENSNIINYLKNAKCVLKWYDYDTGEAKFTDNKWGSLFDKFSTIDTTVKSGKDLSKSNRSNKLLVHFQHKDNNAKSTGIPTSEKDIEGILRILEFDDNGKITLHFDYSPGVYTTSNKLKTIGDYMQIAKRLDGGIYTPLGIYYENGNYWDKEGNVTETKDNAYQTMLLLSS